jgi:hypothetical protein
VLTAGIVIARVWIYRSPARVVDSLNTTLHIGEDCCYTIFFCCCSFLSSSFRSHIKKKRHDGTPAPYRTGTN